MFDELEEKITHVAGLIESLTLLAKAEDADDFDTAMVALAAIAKTLSIEIEEVRDEVQSIRSGQKVAAAALDMGEA